MRCRTRHALRKKREPKWLSYESHLVVRNSALYRAPFWCYPSGESCFTAKKGPIWLSWRAVLKNGSLFRGRAFFSPNMIMKKKNSSSTKESRFSKLLSKRAISALFFLSVGKRADEQTDRVLADSL